MGDFFNSKFVSDLKEGKLPSVTVELDNASLVKVFLAGTAIIITFFVVRKIFMK